MSNAQSEERKSISGRKRGSNAQSEERKSILGRKRELNAQSEERKSISGRKRGPNAQSEERKSISSKRKWAKPQELIKEIRDNSSPMANHKMIGHGRTCNYNRESNIHLVERNIKCGCFQIVSQVKFHLHQNPQWEEKR